MKLSNRYFFYVSNKKPEHAIKLSFPTLENKQVIVGFLKGEITPLLTKIVQFRWLDISLGFFFRLYVPQLSVFNL